ncbi:MAG: hypothetical protein JSS46_00470 [Proteobacteria bacterium]|jgi:hypothetical protein|nr:hypothetical protein [Pseudomonadota bacterium]
MSISESLASLGSSPLEMSSGRILPWHLLAGRSRGAEEAHVPLLAMRLVKPLAPQAERRAAFTVALIRHAADTPVASLRLQVGTGQFHWLAHPDDPELRQLLDRWGDRGRCAFLLVDDRTATVAALNYYPRPLAGWVLASTCTDADMRRFADAAFNLAVSGEIAQRATSDILGIPALKHVEVSILATAAVLRARPLTVMAPTSSLRH